MESCILRGSEGVPERDEVLDTEDIYACLGGGRLCLVKLVDAVRRNV